MHWSPSFSISASTQRHLEKLDKASVIFELFALDETMLTEMHIRHSVSCFNGACGLLGAEEAIQSIELATRHSGKGYPSNCSETILSFRYAQKYLEQVDGEWELKHLLKAQQILLRRPGLSFDSAGRLRNLTESPEETSYSTAYPASELLPALLDRMLQWLNQSAYHPWITAWLLHFHLLILSPFVKGNLGLALVALRAYVARTGHLNPSLLQIEHYLFEKWGAHNSLLKNSLFDNDYTQLLSADLTSYLAHSIEIASTGLDELIQDHQEAYRKQIGYYSLAPRSRNRVNYLTEDGLDRHLSELTALNKRQLKIIEHLALNSPISTKALVMCFKCDRKTIQRDFTKLASMNLVKSQGKTKTVQYFLCLD